MRFANQISFDFDGEIGILDRLSYVASAEPIVQISVIESEGLSRLLRAQFELSWQQSSQKRVDFSAQ
ncbi:hypothetical protein GF380_00470 [Candidatus Uhrbacteria bacterium]|nr:hypothetical protein [Candidatus Uhrbacteria bacterium]